MSGRLIAFSLTGFIVFANLVAIVAVTGSALAGKTLFFVILAAPLVMLVLAGMSRLSARRGAADEDLHKGLRRDSMNQQAKAFLFVAGFAVLAIIVLMVSVTMTKTGEGVVDAAGWVLIFGFGALAVLLGSMCFLPLTLLGVLARVGGRQNFHRGRRLYIQGRYTEALEAFRAHTVAVPDDDRGLIAEASVLGRLGRAEEALALADEVVGKERTAESVMARATALLSLGVADLALRDVAEARGLKSNVAADSIIAGAALISLRRLDEAIDSLEAEPASKRTAASRLLLGDAYRLSGHAERGITAYAAAVKLSPIFSVFDRALGHGFWACALAELDKTDDAVDHAEIALEVEPANGVALYATTLIQLKRREIESLHRPCPP